jgi:hypothetical protein
LFEVLNLADQARLEGRRGSANSAAAIEAAAILIRIAYRFQVIAGARLAGSELALPLDVQERCAVLEQHYCDALESALGVFESGSSAAFSAVSGQSRVDPTRMIEKLATGGMPEGGGRSAHLESELAAQLESYRRLPILLAGLDEALSKIAAS